MDNKKLVSGLLLMAAIAGCATTNNGQQGGMSNAARDTGLGTLIGGLGGALLGKAACNGSVSCRNALIVTGAVAGAAIGYKTGYEKDLEFARKMEQDLRNQGYQPVLTTQEVEVQVPTDRNTGESIPNDQVNAKAPDQVVYKPRKVTKLASLTVQPKNKNDPVERARLSQYLLDNGNKMTASNQSQILTVPAAHSEQDRQQIASLTQLARQKNMVVKQDPNSTVYMLASK